MRVHFDMDWLTRALLVSVRISAMLWATPIFALGRVPVRVKLLAVIAFGAALSTLINAPVPQSAGSFVVAALAEVGIGALMAFGLHCAFGALQFGGRLLDLQMGFGIANLINPSSDEQEPLLGTVLLAVGVMTFYLIDGHHWLVRGVGQSYEWLPLGVAPGVVALDALVAQFVLMFTMGTVLVAPVIARPSTVCICWSSTTSSSCRGGAGFENRQQEIASISRSLKQLAKELHVPIVALSQLSRAPEARSDRRPQLADLRESGALEQNADVVVFIYRAELYDKDEARPEDQGVAELIVGKQRNGPTGTVRLTFIKEYTRFENLART